MMQNEMSEVVECICMGVDETKVLRYRRQDVKGYAALSDHTQKEPLSEPLQEFVKVFPPPYRYDEGEHEIQDCNGRYVMLGFSRTQKERKMSIAINHLICTLLNKYINETK